MNLDQTRKYFLIISFLLIANFCSAQGNHARAIAKIGEEIFNFELALTQEEQLRGLKFREELPEDSGMLFVYEEPQVLRFYMKDTSLPLDIAFLDANFIIVDIQKLEPFKEIPVFSKTEAKYALEINQGFFKKFNLKIGDTLQIEFTH